MSRLRTPTKYNKRSYRSNTEKIKKIFVIAVEGNITEVQYFMGIYNNKDKIGIPNIINIEVLDRMDTNSAPAHVVALLEEYIEEGHTDEFIERFKESVNEAELGDSAENLMKRYFRGELSPRIKQNLEKLIYEADKDRIYYQYLENWNIESKEFCVIFDRDAQTTKPWSFTEIVKNCLSKGYRVAITNPCFEFWLLLHLCNPLEDCSLEELKENKRINANKRFVDNKLSEVLSGYNKSNIEFEKNFMDNIDLAIEREKNFATYWKDIINNVGCNIGALIEEMRKS